MRCAVTELWTPVEVASDMPRPRLGHSLCLAPPAAAAAAPTTAASGDASAAASGTGSETAAAGAAAAGVDAVPLASVVVIAGVSSEALYNDVWTHNKIIKLPQVHSTRARSPMRWRCC